MSVSPRPAALLAVLLPSSPSVKSVVLSLTLAILASGGWVAHADPIRTPFPQIRVGVSTNDNPGSGGVLTQFGDALLERSLTADTPATRTVSTARLASETGAFHASGSGSVFTSFDAVGDIATAADALSNYALSLHLDSAYLLDFFGNFRAAGFLPDSRDGNLRVSNEVVVFRAGSGEPLLNHFFNTADLPPTADREISFGFGTRGLLLAPGDYEARVGAFAIGFRNHGGTSSLNADFDFTFNLTRADPVSPTPEPGSLLLLTTGAMGVGMRLRSRMRRLS